MSKKPKYYIIEASALPEVFLKVAEAKRLLSSGLASTVNDATRMTGISRSAFYKYRDAILPFQNMMTGRIITFQFMVQDEPGVLSSVLTELARHHANILTINSIIPTNGCALVTIGAETMEVSIPLEELLSLLSALPGIIKAEVLAGSGAFCATLLLPGGIFLHKMLHFGVEWCGGDKNVDRTKIWRNLFNGHPADHGRSPASRRSNATGRPGRGGRICPRSYNRSACRRSAGSQPCRGCPGNGCLPCRRRADLGILNGYGH